VPPDCRGRIHATRFIGGVVGTALVAVLFYR
jgi:hypothetical protein